MRTSAGKVKRPLLHGRDTMDGRCLVLVISLIASGCLSGEPNARANLVHVTLDPRPDAARSIPVTDADAEIPALRRLVEALRGADGRQASFTVTTDEAEAMTEVLGARWKAAYDTTFVPVVVQHGTHRYSVSTTV